MTTTAIVLALLTMSAVPGAEPRAAEPRPAEPRPTDTGPTDPGAAGHLHVSARMLTKLDEPRPRQKFEITVKVDDGWSWRDAGIPGIFIQLDVPESISLYGKVLEAHNELAKNEFLQAPFERIVRPGTHTIDFNLHTLDRAPNEMIGINIVAYLRAEGEDPDDGEAWFVRKRLELPMWADAVAIPGDANRSTWGGERLGERSGLHIGDIANDFSLPRKDGSRIKLSEYRGKNAIVTTYRAFWWPFCAKQLGELQRNYDAFEALDIQVIAVSQEDKDIQSHGRFHQHFDPAPRFEIVADIGRMATKPYGRTRTYLVDSEGVVIQVFPNLIHHRASWRAVLNEAKRLLGE